MPIYNSEKQLQLKSPRTSEKLKKNLKATEVPEIKKNFNMPDVKAQFS